MKKYLITMPDRYLTLNEAKALEEIFNCIEQLNKMKSRKIGYDAYTIRIDLELEQYLEQIKLIVKECECKIYSTQKTYKELEQKHLLSMKNKKII